MWQAENHLEQTASDGNELQDQTQFASPGCVLSCGLICRFLAVKTWAVIKDLHMFLDSMLDQTMKPPPNAGPWHVK